MSFTLKHVLGDAALLWLSQMAGILISVAAGIMLTRELGPEARGVYAWLLTTVALGSFFGMCGFDGINRRFGSAEPQSLGVLIRLNLIIVGGVSTLLALGLGLWAHFTPAAGADSLAIVLAMLALIPMGLTAAMAPMLMIESRIGRTAAFGFFPRVMLAMGLGLLLLYGVATVRNALLVNAIVAFFSLALMAFWLSASWRQPSLTPLKTLARQIGWAGGGSLFLAGICQFYMQKLDVVMMGLMLSPRDVGLYAVASNMVDIMVTPAGALAWVFAARLAGNTQSHNRIKPLLALLLAAVISGATLVYFLSPWFIPLLYGKAFMPAVPLLQALCPAVVALSVFYILQASLSVVGRLRWLPLPPLIGLVSNVALNWFWMPAYGAIGAAWASGVAYTLATLLAGGLLWWHFRHHKPENGTPAA